MTMLPTGTVTILFTDIQGSTRLWQAYPDTMPAALARHHLLLRSAIESHQGYVFQIIGDAFCAAFANPADAVNAALVAQRALRDETWGKTGPIHVRMALETGPVEVHAGEYVSGEYASGLTLSRAARLLGIGHGGQVLLSAATAELVRNHLAANVSLRDLGTHRLKDLEQPLRIFQLVALDLQISFPLLKTADRLVHSLPAPLTRFIGRERELSEIMQLLSVSRLVTLTGPGGAGKTRLSIEVARALADQFQDGAAWLSLAEISDPALVDSAMAHALNLDEMMGGKPGDLLKEYVQQRQMLLVIDNFEQVTAAAPLLAELLSIGPDLCLLVTSREALHLQGEQQYPVPPLGSDRGFDLTPEELLRQNSAVQLFVERARAVKPAFALSDENKQAVVEITARLDGLPLAIELAAARVKILSPAAVLKQLKENGLGLLSSTVRDLPSRQQTLRGAIAWSDHLLPAREQDLFRRLGVFSGGASLAVIAAVCAGDVLEKDEILELVAALVDKSLLVQHEDGDEARFVMLETIREYALEKLRECGQEEALRDRHLAYYLQLANEAASAMRGPAQRQWFDRLEGETGNLREALEWCRVDPARAHLGLQLAAALGLYWLWHNHLSEGQIWLSEMLALDPDPSEARGTALAALCEMVFYLGEFDRAVALWHEGLQVYRALDDPAGMGHFLAGEGLLAIFSDDLALARELLAQGVSLLRQAGNKPLLAEALSYYGYLGIYAAELPGDMTRVEEAVTLLRELGNQVHLAVAVDLLGTGALRQKDFPRAYRLLREAVERAHALGAAIQEMNSRGHLAEIAIIRGDLDEARAHAQQALETLRSLQVKRSIPWMLDLLGLAALGRGDPVDAQAYFRESIELYRQIGRALSLAESLAGFAGVALLQQDVMRSIRLLAASRNIVDRAEGRLGPADDAVYDRDLALARSEVSPEAFDQAWAEGYEMELEQAIAYALQ